MSDKFKNSKFYQTMKDPKVSRTIYISLVVLLIAVALVIGITAAANRKRAENDDKKPPQVTSGHGDNHVPNGPSDDTAATTPEETTVTDAPVSDAPVVSALPSFSLPVSGKLTKGHDAKVQVFSTTMNDYRVHLGVDIATAADSPVYAAADGTVQKIWKDPLMGYSLAIKHGGNSVTVYKNLAETLADGIAEGKSVKAGQKLGSVGESAMIEVAEEPHLHLEMTVGGLQVDPLEYFSASDLKKLEADTGYEG